MNGSEPEITQTTAAVPAPTAEMKSGAGARLGVYMSLAGLFVGIFLVGSVLKNRNDALIEAAAQDMVKAPAARRALSKQDSEAAARAAQIEAYKAAGASERTILMRGCAWDETCGLGKMELIAQGAEDEGEKQELVNIVAPVLISKELQQAEDGTTFSSAAVKGAVSRLKAAGPWVFDNLKTSDLLEAAKDPDGVRGKLLKGSGTIVEIRKSHDLYEGAVYTNGGTVVRFVTPFDTPGIVKGTRVKFRGAFAQEFSYPNVSGGQTRSLLIVGEVTKAT